MRKIVSLIAVNGHAQLAFVLTDVILQKVRVLHESANESTGRPLHTTPTCFRSMVESASARNRSRRSRLAFAAEAMPPLPVLPNADIVHYQDEP